MNANDLTLDVGNWNFGGWGLVEKVLKLLEDTDAFGAGPHLSGESLHNPIVLLGSTDQAPLCQAKEQSLFHPLSFISNAIEPVFLSPIHLLGSSSDDQRVIFIKLKTASLQSHLSIPVEGGSARPREDTVHPSCPHLVALAGGCHMDFKGPWIQKRDILPNSAPSLMASKCTFARIFLALFQNITH